MTSVREAIEEGIKIFNVEAEKHMKKKTVNVDEEIKEYRKEKVKKKVKLKAIVSHKDAQGRTRCKRCNHALTLGKCTNYICPTNKSK